MVSRRFLIYLLAFFIVFLYYFRIKESQRQLLSTARVPYRSSYRHFSDEPNIFKVGPDSDLPKQVEIALNDLIELDFKTVAEIMESRKAYVERHSGLLEKEYFPFKAPFGNIVDGKPWWGIEGQFCKGPGKKSIQGPSEETRFLANPYLLLGLDESKAFTMRWMNPCFAVYPRPVTLHWFPQKALAEVRYDMSRFFRERKRLPEKLGDYHRLQFINYNARDFGYNYVTADLAESHNVKRTEGSGLFDKICPLRSFIHLGGSCGYPGNCNNQSPHEPDLFFTVTSLPAELHCKLWKRKPDSQEAPADFTFVIKMR